MKIIGIRHLVNHWKRSNKNILLICFLICLTASCRALTKNGEITENKCFSEYDVITKKQVYTYVDIKPQYGKGLSSVGQYIVKELVYPDQERFQATFLIEFVINNDGELISPRIKNKQFHQLTKVEKEILMILNDMPKWKPGICDKKAVPVKVTLPLKF